MELEPKEKEIDNVLQKFNYQSSFEEEIDTPALLPSALNDEISPGSQTEKLKREMQQLAFYNPGPSTKDLLGFKPEFSNREIRKLNRLLDDKNTAKRNKFEKNVKRVPIYDQNGALLDSGEDLCDCLISSCVGCHFACTRCGSSKCGVTCRCDRSWKYDSIHYDMLQTL